MDEEINALLSRANLARVRGNLSEAEAICLTAIELNPSSAEAQSLLGDLFAAQGKHDEALHCYSFASELKPGNASFREKRDKAVKARHSRLQAAQQAQAQTVKQAQAAKPAAPAPKATAPVPVEKKKPGRPRWLIAVLVGVGGVVMLLLGIWLGNMLAHRNDLVPIKTPAVVGREN